MDLNLDIATTVKVILIFIAIGLISCVYYAVQSINTAKHLEFFQKRQTLIAHAWRLVFLAIFLSGVWVWVYKRAEPIAYQYFPPSPTSTLTPTITFTPTITPTLKWTLTPTITETLQYTYTPDLPSEAQATIQTPIGPDSNAVFSNVWFDMQLNRDRMVENTGSNTFTTPVTHLYGGFSYTDMSMGVQWTAAWLFEGKIICLETSAWTYAPGGYGYTECQLPADQWLPGNYEVQIFAGQTWKASGTFTIVGNVIETSTPATDGVTPTPVPTSSPTTPN